MLKKTPSPKWRILGAISLAELLVMAVWFSASAIMNDLTDLWGLSSNGQAWLTMAVQIGFVTGALGSAILNLADRIPAPSFFVVSSVLCGLATISIPLFSTGFTIALILRFATGVFLAGVYPVGMKLMATWTKEDRGLGIGLLVGALVIGTASPHALKVLGGISGNWQIVMYLAGFSAFLGALIVALTVQEGPYRTASVPFKWRQIGRILRQRDVVLANLGYLGHMWELYAMWTWISVFLAASFKKADVADSSLWASFVTFLVIASGGLGSLVAGKFADRWGRTTLTIGSLIISGLCASIVGLFYGTNPFILTGLVLVWGLTIVADSAQFSACVSELCAPELIGTALTLQTSLGFLLTMASIRLTPTIQSWVGWEWTFLFLIIGPVVGITAMLRLRQSPEALKLANGNR